MKTPRPIVLHAILAMALGTNGCGSKRDSSTTVVPAVPAVDVQVQNVERKSRVVNQDIVGTVRARLRATLEARLTARIEKLPVLLGDKVQKGQLIARLDATEIAARLAQADASREQAKRDWERSSALFEQRSATRTEYDASEARWHIAEAALAEAKAMMGYIEIVAPFDGVVSKKWTEIGDLAVPGKPLVEIDDLSTLQLEADIPESIASFVSRDAQLNVRIDPPDRQIVGVVREIAPVTDPASHTFRVKLDLPQTPGLMPGQFARMSLPIGEKTSIRVPIPAVVLSGQLEIVFCIVDQRARLQLVKTGKRVGDEIEILSGLEPGTTLVIGGAGQLTDGQLVAAR